MLYCSNHSVMKHSSGKWKTILLVLRSLQVLIGLISFISCGLALSVLVVLHEVVVRGIADSINTLDTNGDNHASNLTDSAVSPTDTMPGVLVMADAVVILLLIGALVMTVVALASLICSIIWLVYTASSKSRARSCGGNCAPCVGYGCDIGWDCFWALIWSLNLMLSLGENRPGLDSMDAATVFCAAMVTLFISSAVVSAKVRTTLLLDVTAPDNLCDSDLEIAWLPAEKGAVKTPIKG